MTQKNPSDRPTIHESLECFSEIIKRQPPKLLRQLLVYRDATRLERFLRDVGTFKREAILTAKSCLCRSYTVCLSMRGVD